MTINARADQNCIFVHNFLPTYTYTRTYLDNFYSIHTSTFCIIFRVNLNPKPHLKGPPVDRSVSSLSSSRDNELSFLADFPRPRDVTALVVTGASSGGDDDTKRDQLSGCFRMM